MVCLTFIKKECDLLITSSSHKPGESKSEEFPFTATIQVNHIAARRREIRQNLLHHEIHWVTSPTDTRDRQRNNMLGECLCSEPWKERHVS